MPLQAAGGVGVTGMRLDDRSPFWQNSTIGFLRDIGIHHRSEIEQAVRYG